MPERVTWTRKGESKDRKGGNRGGKRHRRCRGQKGGGEKWEGGRKLKEWRNGKGRNEEE